MKRALCSVSLAIVALAIPSAIAAPAPTQETAKTSLTQTLAHERFKSVQYDSVTRVQDIELPNGQTVTLRLERFDVRRPGTRVIEVDEFGVEHEMGDNGLRMFRGKVEGNPDSTVFLASSPFFTNGFIDTTKDLYSISSGQAVTRASEATHPITIVDVNSIIFENKAPFPCGSDPAFENYVDLAANITLEPEVTTTEREDVCRIVDIAIDTDYEYTDRIFNGNTNASAAYAESLLGAISVIYQRDVDTTLVTGYIRVFKNNNDPYTDSGDALNQVSSHWRNNQGGVQRNLVHYLTGRTNLSYGGVAYLSAVCDASQGYGVSAYLAGSYPQPVQDNISGNWDIVVMAHELGHNHGTGHTHDSYAPTIDDCGNGDCALASKGTIMSYCHTCGGGISNIRLGFHARVRATMGFYLASIPNCDITDPSWLADADAVDDYAETLTGIKIGIDVLDNDFKGSCMGNRPDINTHNSNSAMGGTVGKGLLQGTLLTGLLYTPPEGFEGVDTFNYTNKYGDVGTVTVNVYGFRPRDVVENLEPGIYAEYFDYGQELTALPDTTGLTPDASEMLDLVDVPLSSSTFEGSGLSEQFAAKITGYFIAPGDFNYTFFLDSDDGSRLWIGNQLIIDHDGNHPYSEATGEIPLQAGPHEFTIEYFQNTGDSGLSFSFSFLGIIKMLIDPVYLKSPAAPSSCPADFNLDGFLDSGDISAFVDLYLAGDLAADLNLDGFLDSGDIGAFVSAFLEGC